MEPDSMNLHLYFDPVDFEHFQTQKKFNRHVLGFSVEKATRRSLAGRMEKVRIAIAGVPDDRNTPNKGTSKAPDEIRRHLYHLSSFEQNLPIIDLGNLKPEKQGTGRHYAIRDVVDHLREAGIVTVVLGGGQDISIGIARAFHGTADFSLAIADARADLQLQREPTDATNFITRILRENPHLFHLQLLGIQEHYTSPGTFGFLKRKTFGILQLGRFRSDPHAVEPMLRNSHFLSFDISSVKQPDAGAHYRPSPNGFYAEEACLIARYAGLSPRLSVFGLFEVNPALEKRGNTAELASQMVWYFLESALRRKPEDPLLNKEAFTRYFVEMEDHGEPLVFYHQPSTNRWWVEIFPGEGKSWIIACGEPDYRQALARQIPDICWHYLTKTTRLSK